jgi:hypothetical protein
MNSRTDRLEGNGIFPRILKEVTRLLVTFRIGHSEWHEINAHLSPFACLQKTKQKAVDTKVADRDCYLRRVG